MLRVQPVCWPDSQHAFSAVYLQIRRTIYLMVPCCLQAVIPILTLPSENSHLRTSSSSEGRLYDVSHSSTYLQGVVNTCHRIQESKCMVSSERMCTNFRIVQIN